MRREQTEISEQSSFQITVLSYWLLKYSKEEKKKPNPPLIYSLLHLCYPINRLRHRSCNVGYVLRTSTCKNSNFPHAVYLTF